MIDSHCHIDFKDFNKNRDEIIQNACDAGIHTLINIGADLESSERSVQLADKHDMIYATVGIHPHDAKTLDQATFDRLKELTKHKKVVGIGEIGLDYYRDLSPRNIQKDAFRKQLKLAVELNLPVVIHTRESFDDTLEIIKDYSSDLPGGVFHCFPGTIDDALEVISLGFVISVGGVITFNKAKMAEVAAEVTIDKIILETDAPYLTPVPYRGQQNQPAYVRYVYEKMAQLKEMPFNELVKIVDRNCQKLFHLVETFGE
jgi:TatD DNase family protein